MSENTDNVTPIETGRKLAEAVRAVKNAAADRDDVVIDMRDAERMRLELLANELAPVISEVPDEIDVFDFAISSGLQPRFWIDSVSHVAMGRDKRSYRFVTDTRNGRVVLAESPEIRPVADSVTRYVAERIVERERMMEGGVPTAYRNARPAPAIESQAALQPAAANSTTALQLPIASEAAPATQPVPEVAVDNRKSGGWKTLFWSLAVFLLGGAAGFSVMATQWWEQVSQRVIGQ